MHSTPGSHNEVAGGKEREREEEKSCTLASAFISILGRDLRFHAFALHW